MPDDDGNMQELRTWLRQLVNFTSLRRERRFWRGYKLTLNSFIDELQPCSRRLWHDCRLSVVHPSVCPFVRPWRMYCG